MSFVDRIKSFALGKREPANSLSKSSTIVDRDTKNGSPIPVGDVDRLRGEYIRDVEGIGPDTPIEEAQRRLYNLTHFDQTVANAQRLTRDKLFKNDLP